MGTVDLGFIGVNQTPSAGTGPTMAAPVQAFSTVGGGQLARPYARNLPAPLAAPVINVGYPGCGTWHAVLCDPLLRPLRRLQLRGGTIDWKLNGAGAANLTFRPFCQNGDFLLGWHHLALWRTSHPHRPMWAGRIQTFDSRQGTVSAEDLSAWLGSRVVMAAGLGQNLAADPTVWLSRALDDANHQGRLPIIPVRYGPAASVEIKLGLQPGALLSSVLSDLQRYGVVWTMQGPYLRYGVGNTGPVGGLLTRKHFKRLHFDLTANVVTQVIALGANGKRGSWPNAGIRMDAPTGVITVDNSEMTSVEQLTKVAKIHYEQQSGPSIKVTNQELARRAPVQVWDLVPGRRFTVTDGRDVLLAQVQDVSATLAGAGLEAAVSVSLDRADSSAIRKV